MKVSAFLCAGHKVSEVASLVGVLRTTVNAIKMCMDGGEDVNRRAGSGRRTVVDRDSLRDVIRSSPMTSMRQHARRLGGRVATVRRAVAKLGAKPRVIVEGPLLTPASALNFPRCSLMISSLHLLPGSNGAVMPPIWFPSRC